MTRNEVREECMVALSELTRLCKPPWKLTLVMRNPESHDGDLVISDDDLTLVQAALERLKTYPPDP